MNQFSFFTLTPKSQGQRNEPVRKRVIGIAIMKNNAESVKEEDSLGQVFILMSLISEKRCHWTSQIISHTKMQVHKNKTSCSIQIN